MPETVPESIGFTLKTCLYVFFVLTTGKEKQCQKKEEYNRKYQRFFFHNLMIENYNMYPEY